MAKQILCPYCSKSFPADKALYQCTNMESFQGQDKCPKVVDPILNNHWKKEGIPSRRVFPARVFAPLSHKVRSARCPYCHEETTRVVCPECHNVLPKAMLEEGSTIISIIGDRSSGKTVYFLSLMNELQEYGYKIGVPDVYPWDYSYDGKTSSSAVYTDLKNKMFTHCVLPEQTRAVTPIPMIFRMEFTGKKQKKSEGIYIVFYDTAGEIFQNAERIDETARFLKDSAGVIFLIDPFSLDGLHETLVQGGIISDDEGRFVGADPSRVFDSLRQFTGNERLKDKPLALTFSKIDAVLSALDNCPQGYKIQNVNLQKNSSFITTGKFDVDEIERIHESLKSVAEDKWRAGKFWGRASGVYAEGNVRMFAMSALGNNPDKNGNIKKPTPYRVMDPLVWILYKIGYDIPLA